MQIRTRLTLFFTLNTAFILAGVLFYVWWSYNQQLEEEFYQGLASKARLTARTTIDQTDLMLPLPVSSWFAPDTDTLPYQDNVSLYNSAYQRVFSMHEEAPPVDPWRNNTAGKPSRVGNTVIGTMRTPTLHPARRYRPTTHPPACSIILRVSGESNRVRPVEGETHAATNRPGILVLPAAEGVSAVEPDRTDRRNVPEARARRIFAATLSGSEKAKRGRKPVPNESRIAEQGFPLQKELTQPLWESPGGSPIPSLS